MSGLLFVSQAMLDSWAEQGKIDFVGNVMTLFAGDGQGRSYALDPAVRFMKLLGELAAARAAPAPPVRDAASRSLPLGSAPLPKDLEEERKETDALARFLLEKLS